MKFLLCFLLVSNYALAETNLLLIGGGKRPVEAMKTFVNIAGLEKADILIFPWASESIEAAESIKIYTIFKLRRAKIPTIAYRFVNRNNPDFIIIGIFFIYHSPVHQVVATI